jgi:hypothetical protein
MKKKNRVFFFILINILISAGTTFFVLWLWERLHPQPITDANPSITGVLDENPDTIQSSTSETDDPDLVLSEHEMDVAIYAVVGVGNLDVEYVEIRNQSQGAVDPAGWQILDEDGNNFTFPTSPSWLLSSSGAVKVLSKSGNNSVIELYWESNEPIWQSGERVTLLNAEGKIIATYLIP